MSTVRRLLQWAGLDSSSRYARKDVALVTSDPSGRRSMFLRSSRDIEWVKRHGRRISTHFFNLLACRRDAPGTQVGIVVGRRFGVAVRRNRAKRIFRELVRQFHRELLPGQALLIFPKRDALAQPYTELRRMWETVLLRADLLRPRTH